ASPENQKSLTIIEVICADGTAPPPPVIICPGEKIMESWIHENLTGVEVITVSPTGYTNENIALAWLDHFIKHMEAGPDKQWHMLLVDGHITHCQDNFIIKCHKNHIIPFEFPSDLTHILQPLDVGVFHPWKHYHKQTIHHALRSLDIEYTISSFFRDLDTIRKQTFQSHIIKNSFKNSGMFPVSYKNAIKKM
ncbi:DDE-domain-containing protein, partial [Choiromyces venosus 120613-1]